MMRFITAFTLFMYVITGDAQFFINRNVSRHNIVSSKVPSGYGIGYSIELFIILDKKSPTYYLVVDPENSTDLNNPGSDPINCMCLEYITEGKLKRIGNKDLSSLKTCKENNFLRDTKICVRVDFYIIEELYKSGLDRINSLTFGCCRGEKYNKLSKIIWIKLKPYQSRNLYNSFREIYEETMRLVACGKIDNINKR